VVLADNGSTDDSIKCVEEKFKGNPKLKIVMNTKNYGFAEGNNQAIKHATGQYLIFLNNDAEVEPQWIKELINVMEADPTIGVAQSKILSMDMVHIQTVGNLLDPVLLTYLAGYDEKDNGQFSKVFEITFASGASFITRRELIEKIGLFDPKYFFYHDDCDFGWRVRLAGYKIVVVPSSVIYHKGGGTSANRFRNTEKFFYLFASRFGLFIKYYELKNVLKFGGLMAISILMDVFDEDLRHGDIRTPLRFAIWLVRNFRYNWKKRLEMQLQIRKVSDDVILKTFLDLSLFVFRITRRFGKSLNDIIYDYYSSHTYGRPSM